MALGLLSFPGVISATLAWDGPINKPSQSQPLWPKYTSHGVGGEGWRCKCYRHRHSAHPGNTRSAYLVGKRSVSQPDWGILGCNGPRVSGLAYGLDPGSNFVVSQGIFKMLSECLHETVKVAQLWGIIIVEGDHPLSCEHLQCHGYTPLLHLFGGYFWMILLHVGPEKP